MATRGPFGTPWWVLALYKSCYVSISTKIVAFLESFGDKSRSNTLSTLEQWSFNAAVIWQVFQNLLKVNQKSSNETKTCNKITSITVGFSSKPFLHSTFFDFMLCSDIFICLKNVFVLQESNKKCFINLFVNRSLTYIATHH